MAKRGLVGGPAKSPPLLGGSCVYSGSCFLPVGQWSQLRKPEAHLPAADYSKGLCGILLDERNGAGSVSTGQSSPEMRLCCGKDAAAHGTSIPQPHHARYRVGTVPKRAGTWRNMISSFLSWSQVCGQESWPNWPSRVFALRCQLLSWCPEQGLPRPRGGEEISALGTSVDCLVIPSSSCVEKDF